MEESKLNTFNIYSIADTLNTKLVELGVMKKCLLSFTVQDDEFKKIDEDLFYRMNPNGSEFTPSDNEINITYGNVNIIIEKEQKEIDNG